MKVSIVLITYNRCIHLKKCVKALLELKPQADEIIIVDNASSDATQDMLTKEFPNIKVIRSKTNIGIPAGRNLGFQNASGDICISLDDDAVLRPLDIVSKVKSHFNNNEDLACISFQIYKDDGKTVAKHYIPRLDKKIITEDCLGANFVGTGHAIDRKKFLELGGYWEDLGLYFGEEPDLSYRFLEHNYQILHSYELHVLHEESNISRPSGRRVYHGVRNTPWIAIKNLPFYSIINLTLMAWIYFFFISITSGTLIDYLQGVRDSVFGFKKIFKQRKPISNKTITALKKYSGVYRF